MSYSRLSGHTAMVFDDVRNQAYLRAIRSHVRPDSVVLDLGAGMGMHGLLAALAGAARVYLVEPQPAVNAARDVATRAGIADRIEIIQSRIEDAVLPEKVDVLVSVFTGNLLFQEDLLPSLFFARDRFLKPDGAMVPGRAQLWLAPVMAPELHRLQVSRWSKPLMGLDYSGAREAAANEIQWLRPSELQGTVRLATPSLACDVNYHVATNENCEADVNFTATTEGTCHGLLGWVRMELGDEWLDCDPASPEVHWSAALLPVDPPLALRNGESISARVRRPAFGDWSWTIQCPSGTRRHSTFLSGFDMGKRLGRLAPDAAPGLGDAGEKTLCVLESLSRGASNKAAAAELSSRHGMTPADALQLVQRLAVRYGANP